MFNNFTGMLSQLPNCFTPNDKQLLDCALPRTFTPCINIELDNFTGCSIISLEHKMEEEDIEPVQVLGQTLPNQCSGWQFCGMLGCFLEELKMPCPTRSWSLYDLHQHLAWWFHRYIHPFTKLKHSWWLTDCLTVGLFPYTLCSLLAFRLTMHRILHCFLEGLKILNLFAMRYQSLHYLYSSLQTFRSMTLHVCSLIY